MSQITGCVVAADGERIHRYVAGTLESETVAEFEMHLLGCAECQAAVREAAGVAAALRRVSAPVVDSVRVRRGSFWWAVPLAAAAGILWLVVSREGPLARLGRVSRAPAFAGVAVRSDVDSTGLLADSGMAAYVHGRYREAAHLLAAVPAEERTPGVRFYLGIATLLGGAPQDAARRLAEVPVESPYSAEARFYRAKAWLRLGRADSALVELAGVPKDAAVAVRAAALTDSVKGVLH